MRFYQLAFLILFLATAGIAIGENKNVTSDAEGKPRRSTKKQSRRLDCRAFLTDGIISDEPMTWKERLHQSLLVWRRRRRWRRGHTPELAYQMIVMASMSYWDFHKKSSTENPTNFTIQKSDRSKKRKGNVGRNLHKIQKTLGRVLQEGSVSPPLVHREDYFGQVGSLTFPLSKLGVIKNHASCGLVSEGRLVFQYLLYDWYESGVGGVKFHDTDLLIASSDTNRTLVIAFAGTSSAADAFTNVQTFEPANHSNFYNGGERQRGKWTRRHTSRRKSKTSIQGSLHRGFLNAYSRVDRGSVVSLGNGTMGPQDVSYLDPLNHYFQNCTHFNSLKERKDRGSSKMEKSNLKVEGHGDSTTCNSDDESEDDVPVVDGGDHTVRMRRKGVGCFSKGKKLSKILVEVATEALKQGVTVHVTGHSLGGAVASHFVLDLLINHPQINVDKLHLWTFGAPQIADALFISSAMDFAPRMGHFAGISRGGNGQLHRYVTLSDQCRVDLVSEVAKFTLPSHQERGIRGKIARRLGGVQDHIIHIADPYYLLTPNQFDEGPSLAPYHTNDSLSTIDDLVLNGTTHHNNSNDTSATGSTKKSKRDKESSRREKSQMATTTTHSDIAAHACVNYLLGISRESEYHPLMTDFPEHVQEFLRR